MEMSLVSRNQSVCEGRGLYDGPELGAGVSMDLGTTTVRKELSEGLIQPLWSLVFSPRKGI